MSNKIVLALSLGMSLALGACGAVDSHVSHVPDFFKQPAATKSIEQPPNVAAILHHDIYAVFRQESQPTNVRYSFPVPAKYGGWDTCIKASITGVTGQSIGEQTYLVTIDHDLIGRRELVEDHRCAQEVYERL